MYGAEQRDIDQIAEYADSSIRQMVRTRASRRSRGAPGSTSGSTTGGATAATRSTRRSAALLTIGLSGVLAWALDEPLVFPSLGATAFLFETPMAEVASIRNTLIGHTVGTLVPFLWLSVFGLVGDPSAIATGFTADRVACVALSLACTGGLLRLLRAAHPPAGATTVIVSIGLLTTVSELSVLLAGVAVLSAASWALNRALGVPAPAWMGAKLWTPPAGIELPFSDAPASGAITIPCANPETAC